MSDLVSWVVEQQRVAEASVEHNKTAPWVRACVLCGREGTEVSYRFGRRDEPVCRDREACASFHETRPKEDA